VLGDCAVFFHSKLCKDVLSLIESRGGCTAETKRIAIKITNNSKVIAQGYTPEQICDQLGVVDAYEYVEDLKYQQQKNDAFWSGRH
jgi:hypothetical protein